MMHTDTNSKHSHYHNKDVFMAGVAGILAGVAGVTALALSDKDIRRKVGKRAHNLRSTLQDWSAEKLHMIDHHTAKALDTVEKTEKDSSEIKEDEPLKQVAMKN